MTLNALWELYADSIKHRPSYKVRGYYWNVLEPHFGKRKATSITEQDCIDYYNSRKDKVRASTIWGELSLLRTILNWGVRKRHVKPNTFDTWLPQPSPSRSQRLTREEFKKLLDGAVAPHTRLFILLLMSTACRVGAALDLTWDRVDFERGLIDLRSPTSGIYEGKGRAVVPMTQSLRTALLEAKEHATCDHVIERWGRRITDGYNGFKRAAIRAGVPWAHPHIIRHSVATWMAEDGVPMSEIARYLGHNDSIITERVYAKYSPNYLRKAASVIDMENWT